MKQALIVFVGEQNPAQIRRRGLVVEDRAVIKKYKAEKHERNHDQMPSTTMV